MAERRLFHISFNPEIPSHAAAIQYLDSLGRKKASAIAKALEAAGCTGTGIGSSPTMSQVVSSKEVQQETVPNQAEQITNISLEDQASEKSLDIPRVQEQEEVMQHDIPTSPEDHSSIKPEEKQEESDKDDNGIPEVYRNTLMANLNYFDSMEEDDEDL